MPEPGPQLQQVTLVVGETAASAAFYRELGLTVPEDVDGLHVELPQPPRSISLELDHRESASLWNASWRSGTGTSVIIGFAVASREAVDETYGRLVPLGAPVQPPFDAFWGGRYAIVADPDGNQIGLMSPIDPEKRTPTWPPAPSPDL